MILAVSTLAAFIVTFILLPIIIKVSKSIDILDAPDTRKVHHVSTPSLGGIAIFSGFMLAVIIAVPLVHLESLKYLLTGLTLIFILGIRDDVSSLQAKHKLAVQIFAACLVVFFSDIRLTGLYGILGLGSLPYGLNEILTVFVIVALTNSFNLIDGIDGLAGSVAVLVLTFFAWVFLVAGEWAMAMICLTAIGSLMAFLFFNWFPSKVFMGDTGSMLLGFMVSVMAVSFINLGQNLELTSMIRIEDSVAIAVSLLIIPVYDTLRVFCIRFYQGKSPLAPDRNHVHHLLLDVGFNHAQATLTLLIFNATILSLSLMLNTWLGNTALIGGQLFAAGCFGLTLDLAARRRRTLQRATAVRVERDMYISKSA